MSADAVGWQVYLLAVGAGPGPAGVELLRCPEEVRAAGVDHALLVAAPHGPAALGIKLTAAAFGRGDRLEAEAAARRVVDQLADPRVQAAGWQLAGSVWQDAAGATTYGPCAPTLARTLARLGIGERS